MQFIIEVFSNCIDVVILLCMFLAIEFSVRLIYSLLDWEGYKNEQNGILILIWTLAIWLGILYCLIKIGVLTVN